MWSAPTASNSLDNSKVLAVRVPTAYLNNYKDSTLNPWVNITDSKFVWY